MSGAHPVVGARVELDGLLEARAAAPGDHLAGTIL